MFTNNRFINYYFYLCKKKNFRSKIFHHAQPLYPKINFQMLNRDLKLH